MESLKIFKRSFQEAISKKKSKKFLKAKMKFS